MSGGASMAEVAERLAAAGIGLVVRALTPGGEAVLPVPPAEAEAFLADPEGWRAARLGGSVAEYRAWLATAGAPRCAATLADGTRCRWVIGPPLDLAAWAALEPGFCAGHGGPGWPAASGDAGGGGSVRFVVTLGWPLGADELAALGAPAGAGGKQRVEREEDR